MSPPVHVLQLGSPAGLYGAERWILALIRHLDPQLIKSSVAAICDEAAGHAPLCQEARTAGFEAHEIEAFGRVNRAAVTSLRQLIVTHKVQVLHTHGYKTDLIGLLAVRGTRCRIVSTPHGWSVQAGWKLRIYEALDRAAFPFCDAVVPLSGKLYSELRWIPGLGRKLRLINNAVDLSEVEGSDRVADQLCTWREQGDFVIGYIGQLISRKGLDVLIEAFARWPHSHKRLVLVGDGPQREELENLAATLGLADRVSFLGFRDDRLDWLRGFDAFALASRLEGIPRCLMESLAAGVPVVASDIPGCNDLLTDNATGLLVPPDDVAALCGAFERMRDPQLRAALAARGKQHVAASYSAARMAREYQALFADLVAAP